ncbi:MAG: hypothetical protein GY861_12810 [bacterium]|nr:hypothetical protein [bacterium]
MNILHLNLKRKWFDLIASGEKHIEYRELKDYWTERLACKWPLGGQYKKFDEIHFKNGMKRKDGTEAPFMRVKHINTVCLPTINPMTDKFEWMYLIYLGEIIEITIQHPNCNYKYKNREISITEG